MYRHVNLALMPDPKVKSPSDPGIMNKVRVSVGCRECLEDRPDETAKINANRYKTEKTVNRTQSITVRSGFRFLTLTMSACRQCP